MDGDVIRQAGTDLDVPPLGRELHGVRQHVADHLGKTHRVNLRFQGQATQLQIQSQLFPLQLGRQFGGHRLDDVAHVMGLEMEGTHRAIDFGHIEQVVDQLQHALPSGMDVPKHCRQLFVLAAAQHAQLGKAQDGLQRRA